MNEKCRLLYRKAKTSLQRGDVKEAALTCRNLNQLFPGFSDGWHLSSILAFELKNIEAALEYNARAISIEPLDPYYKVHRANCLIYKGCFAEAKVLVETVAAKSHQDVELLNAIATAYSGVSDYKTALKYYRKVLELAPREAKNHYNFASVLRFLGDIDGAEEAYNRGLQLDPHEYESYLVRASLRKQTVDNNHTQEMEELIKSGLKSWRGEVQVGYALAKEYEDLGDYGKSFERLKRASDLKRTHTGYDIKDDIETIDKIIQVYSEELLSQKKNVEGDSSSDPIFVIGLPRTGTTLVERILSSHSEVSSVGEQNTFALEMMGLIRGALNKKTNSKFEAIDCSTQIDFTQLGKNYVLSSREKAQASPYFIDKLPFNYLYCGLISLALPNAKIIELVRHPMDTCYAMYKQLFEHAYPFSYSLSDLGHYYVSYRKLMTHWHRVIPGKIYSLRYENIVAGLESEVQCLLDYCGLSGEDACIQFDRNVQPSTTASATQVRKPIYSTSVGRWKCYEKQLETLAEFLRFHGITI